MFVLDLKPSYLWPVTLRLAADGGDFEAFTFSVAFRRLEQGRIRELLQPEAVRREGFKGLLHDVHEVLLAGELPSEDLMRQLMEASTEAEPMTDEDACRELVMGWEGISDAKGNDVPFSEGALEKLLKISGAPGAIVKAWLESINPEAQDLGKRKPKTSGQPRVSG